MNIADFDFELPAGLIAQEPPATRGGSRLLVLSRSSGVITHDEFANLGRYLRAGDLLVLNDTRVFPARLIGTRVPSGGVVECLLLEKNGVGSDFPREEENGVGSDFAKSGVESTLYADSRAPESRNGVGSDFSEKREITPDPIWLALMHPGQKLKPGARVLFERDGLQLHGEVIARHFHGRRTIRLWTTDGSDVDDLVDRIGHIPLPPYIKRDDRPDDRERYQTVYARERGSVAAPTAGLHFSRELLASLAAQGVEQARVTLHVGYGTFKPIRVEQVEDHTVDPEHFVVDDTAAAALTRARREGRRIIAVGTTALRTLESLRVDDDGRVNAESGSTTLFIRPGHQFRIATGLVTNFHLPRSSLLVLVAAFAGRERVLGAYREAVARGYRFYSYGDAMLIV